MASRSRLMHLTLFSKYLNSFTSILTHGQFFEREFDILHNGFGFILIGRSNHVKLNLFNYVLALFCAKFACDSIFRNLVFRWE